MWNSTENGSSGASTSWSTGITMYDDTVPSTSTATFPPVSAAIECLPTESLLTIFSYLLEQDLCRVSQVCKRFRAIANDPMLWKRLYRDLYEYDHPLFNLGICRFEFVPPEECDHANPWRESFCQLYPGIHVRPGYEDKAVCGRNVLYFDTLFSALFSYELRQLSVKGCQTPLFVHAGLHSIDSLPLDGEVAVIGAAPGNVAEAVVLESATSSSIMFIESTKHAYIGHLTINFSPPNEHARMLGRYLFKIDSLNEPMLDHLIINNSTVDVNTTLMLLSDTYDMKSAWPVLKHCVVRNFENMGHTLIDSTLDDDDRYQLTTFGFKPGLSTCGTMVACCVYPERDIEQAARCPWAQRNVTYANSLNPCTDLPYRLLQVETSEATP